MENNSGYQPLPHHQPHQNPAVPVSVAPAAAPSQAFASSFQPAGPQNVSASSAGVTSPPWSPSPPAHTNSSGDSSSDSYNTKQPMPVVKVWSTRGLEYALMSFSLWFAADALAAILIVMINGGTSFTALSFPISLLIVTLPPFAILFLRLRKAELANPSLILEPSKRRFSQITQVFTFLAVILSAVGIVYSLIAKMGGSYSGSVGKLIGSLIVVIVIAGGIFAYYWIDEHKHQV